MKRLLLGTAAAWLFGTATALAQCSGVAGVPFNCQAGQAPQLTDLVVGGATTGTYLNKTVSWTFNQLSTAVLNFGLSASLGATSATSLMVSGAISGPGVNAIFAVHRRSVAPPRTPALSRRSRPPASPPPLTASRSSAVGRGPHWARPPTVSCSRF